MFHTARYYHAKTIPLLRSKTAIYGKNDNDRPLFNSNANKISTDPGNHFCIWRPLSKNFNFESGQMTSSESRIKNDYFESLRKMEIITLLHVTDLARQGNSFVLLTEFLCQRANRLHL